MWTADVERERLCNARFRSNERPASARYAMSYTYRQATVKPFSSWVLFIA